MIEELLDALEHTDDCDSCPSDDEQENDVVIAIGDSKSQVTSKRRTMRLQGTIGNHEVLILVDSGSVGSFISESLADQLKYQTHDCATTYFVATDGSPMTCTKKIPNLQWATQKHTFLSALKCYDMIVGEDWLEECSPMWVH